MSYCAGKRRAQALRFFNNCPATLEKLYQCVGVLFGAPRRLTGEAGRAGAFSISGGDSDELHHFERDLVPASRRTSGRGRFFWHRTSPTSCLPTGTAPTGLVW